ncbi:hypothetical protein MRX96_017207 [Rhipicephalus microplus]
MKAVRHACKEEAGPQLNLMKRKLRRASGPLLPVVFVPRTQDNPRPPDNSYLLVPLRPVVSGRVVFLYVVCVVTVARSLVGTFNAVAAPFEESAGEVLVLETPKLASRVQ